MKIQYTLSLTVTRPVVPDYDETEDVAIEWMESTMAQRALEREVLAALRRLDGDCDVEVVAVLVGEE